MIRHRFEHRLRQRMRLQQVSKVQDRRLVGDRVAAEFKMAERTHRLDVVERLLGTRIRQVIPAAGSRCATSRQLGTADGRPEGQLSDNAARSKLPASTTAPPPPSRPETRRASYASSS